MALPFSLFLALKYLKPKRSYFSVVTVISVLGVTLGVAVLIIVLSVMSGFDDMWREKILDFDAHITVSGHGPIEEPDEIMARVRGVPQVRAVAPFIQGPVIVRHGGQVFPIVLRGVAPDLEREASRIPENIIEGDFDLADNRAVIGVNLRARTGLRVGDACLVNSPASFMTGDEIHLPAELEVAGVFELGMWEYDAGFVLCSIAAAQEVFDIEEGVHSLKVMVRDPYRAGESAARIQAMLGPMFRVETWMELNRQLFGALRVEKNMMFFLLIFIAVVAAFGITNTLITVTVLKTREIGLLKAIGFSSSSVMRIFFWQGWIEGLAGTSAGIGLGLWVLHYRNRLMHWLSDTFHLELFPKELYHLSEIPSRTAVTDVVIIAASVLLICTLAGLIPAYRAARLDPVEALRHE